MHWLVDNPGALYLALAIAAVAFLVAFRLRGRALHLGLALGCLALIGLFWLLSQWIMTDRKQITSNVRSMAAAVVNADREQLFRYVAPDFQFQTMNRDDLYRVVENGVKQHQVKDVYVSQIEVEELSRPERRAKVNFLARVDSADGQRLFLLKTDFTLDGDVWKIKTMKLYNPLVNQDQPINIPH